MNVPEGNPQPTNDETGTDTNAATFTALNNWVLSLYGIVFLEISKLFSQLWDKVVILSTFSFIRKSCIWSFNPFLEPAKLWCASRPVKSGNKKEWIVKNIKVATLGPTRSIMLKFHPYFSSSKYVHTPKHIFPYNMKTRPDKMCMCVSCLFND